MGLDEELKLLAELSAEAIELLSKFSVPLYMLRGDIPFQFGTGFFVKNNENYYLVSAAHVFDSAKDKQVFYYTEGKKVYMLYDNILLPVKSEANRSTDLIDVAVTKITDNTPPYPYYKKLAVDIKLLKPNNLPRSNKMYIIGGFPASQTSVKKLTNSVSPKFNSMMLPSIPKEDYGKHKLNINDHIAMEINLKKTHSIATKQHRNFPNPDGMSGCIIAVLTDVNNNTEDSSFAIVGVFTTYRKRDKLLFGTDVSYVIDFINEYERLSL